MWINFFNFCKKKGEKKKKEGKVGEKEGVINRIFHIVEG